MEPLSPFRIIIVLGLFGFLVFLPVAGHLITRNDVERELESALVEYQTLAREAFRGRLDRIVRENGLEGSASIVVDESVTDTIRVTIRYPSRMRILLVPVTLEVVLTKATRKLGM